MSPQRRRGSMVSPQGREGGGSQEENRTRTVLTASKKWEVKLDRAPRGRRGLRGGTLLPWPFCGGSRWEPRCLSRCGLWGGSSCSRRGEGMGLCGSSRICLREAGSSCPLATVIPGKEGLWPSVGSARQPGGGGGVCSEA